MLHLVSAISFFLLTISGLTLISMQLAARRDEILDALFGTTRPAARPWQARVRLSAQSLPRKHYRTIRAVA